MARGKKKRKLKIKFKQNAQLVNKKDNTKVAMRDTVKKAPFQHLRDVGANFRIKIKKKQ